MSTNIYLRFIDVYITYERNSHNWFAYYIYEFAELVHLYRYRIIIVAANRLKFSAVPITMNFPIFTFQF